MNQPPVPVARDLTTLTRADLAAAVAAYRAATRGRSQLAFIPIGLGGLACGVALQSLNEWAHGPAWLGWFGFAFGWAVLIGSTIIVFRNAKRFREQYRIDCPNCGASFLDHALDAGGTSSADLAIQTGQCRHCGQVVLAP